MDQLIKLGTDLAKQMFGNFTGEKMQTLRSTYEGLCSCEVDINAELEDAEFQSGKKRKREVENWLENVKKKRNEFLSLEEDVKQSSFLLRLLLGKRTDNMIREMKELVEQGKFSEGLLLDVHEIKGDQFLTTKLIGKAFQSNLQKTLDSLKKDEILSIGIYGMGGAGKTTLAAHIHNLLSEKYNNTFDHVYWVTVSHDFSIHILQDKIAEAVLGKELSNKSDERKRAAELSKVLLQRKKCVFILDDVWNHFGLKEVGIRLMVNGCKLVLTTRFLDVCHRMGCDENIKVEPLPEKETWDLLRETLGHGLTLPPEIEKIAMSVAKRCAGLPLGIIAMAGSMRGVNDICEWRNVLEELEESALGQRDMEDEVFPLLKLSYDRLKDARLQHCFLYCALYPEDYKIKRDELIRYLIAEGLIDRKKSIQAKFDMGHTVLNKLENACLLESCEDVDRERSVKMHDLMREMALEITRRVSPRFMVKAGLQLRKIPGEQEWVEDLDKVSLMNNYIKEIPPGTSPRCRKLSTLLLSRNGFLTKIPRSFFVHMRALRVLDLSKTGILTLPDSISHLESLIALLLQGCEELEYVPPLGNLRELQVLNLSATDIQEVPQGMEMLVNLNCLYMEEMEKKLLLPSGILPKLSHLQVLRLEHARVRVEELEELKLLEEFRGQLYELCDFNRFSSQYFMQLRIYHLIVDYSENPNYSEGYDYSYDKEVRIRSCSLKGGGGEEDRVLLPHDIQKLVIWGCHDVNSLCDVSPSLNKLKKCEISWCDGIECVWPLSFSNEIELEEEDTGEKQESRCVPPLLQSLEILNLISLSNLSVLVKWGRRGGERVIAALPPATFSNLKKMDIRNCHKIKKLFPLGLLLHLQNLESISIIECNEMEEIIAAEDEEWMGTCSSSNNNNSSSSSSSSFFNYNNNNNSSTIFTLPKLMKFDLSFMPKLKSICKGVMACDSIEEVRLFECPQLKRVPFSLPLFNGQPSPPSALKWIKINKEEQGWWELLEWETIQMPRMSFNHSFNTPGRGGSKICLECNGI